MKKLYSILFYFSFLALACRAEDEKPAVLKGNINWSDVQDKEYENNLAKETTLFLDLETTLQMALDKNLTIQVQQYQVKQAKDQVLGSGAEFLPSVSFSQTFLRRDGNIQLFGNQVVPVKVRSIQPAFLPSFRLFQGGRVLFGFLASRQNFKSENQQLESVSQSTLQDTANTYFSLQRFKAELESELTRLAQAELNLKERKIAKELGADIALSILFARQEVEQAKARIEELKGSLYTESAKLNKFLNLNANILVLPTTGIKEQDLISILGEKPVKKLIAKALLNSPDIASLKDLSEYYRLKKIQNISAFLPTVEIRNISSWIGSEFNNLSPDRQYILAIQYDFFQNLGGKAITNLLLAKHIQQENETKLQEQIKELESNVSEAYLKVMSGKKIFLANKTSLQVSQEAYNQSVARLKGEVGTSYEVKIAQTELERARANYYAALINYQIAQISLLRSLGLVNISNLTQGVNL